MHGAQASMFGLAAAALSLVLSPSSASAQPPAASVSIDADDVGGVVRGPNGPEAGVWVIAETVDLPTKYAKMVVTDDAGRYLIPDLPQAAYNIWVRGYGLVDSPKATRRKRRAGRPSSSTRTATAGATSTWSQTNRPIR